LCPFYEITGLTLTLLKRFPKTQNSEKKFKNQDFFLEKIWLCDRRDGVALNEQGNEYAFLGHLGDLGPCDGHTERQKIDDKSSPVCGNPLHRYEFGPPKFSSKTFKICMICYSTWQISGGGPISKSMLPCRSRKKQLTQSDITWNQSEPVKSNFKVEKRREFVRALWDMNNARRILSKVSTSLRGCWFWSKKLHFERILMQIL